MADRNVIAALARQYVATGNVSAVILAGSIGRGRADSLSDVELDVYWTTPPNDGERRAPSVALGGYVQRLWPYDSDDAEWSEDIIAREIDVTVSGFLVARVDTWIDSVAGAADPNIGKQMRVSQGA